MKPKTLNLMSWRAKFLVLIFLQIAWGGSAKDNNPLTIFDSPKMEDWVESYTTQYMNDWMNNYPDFTDEEYKERLTEMSGEIHYKLHPLVKERILARTVRYRSSTETLLGMGDIYFPIFEEHLAKYDVPHHLKYLPIIESRLNPVAKSVASAVGLWQFISSTARFYNLKINSTVDERKDTYKASNAAAKMLSELYKRYGDWGLSLAAYNCGPGRVNKAIQAAGTKDYWVVRAYLPKETQKYVPYFMAVAYVGEYSDLHDLTPKVQATDYTMTDTILIKEGKSFFALAKEYNIHVDSLKFLNPGYLKNYVSASSEGNPIILPTRIIAKVRNFESSYKKLLEIQKENPIRVVRRIGSHMDIRRLMKAYRCSMRDILFWNNLPKGYPFSLGDIVAIRKYAVPEDLPLMEIERIDPINISSLKVVGLDQKRKHLAKTENVIVNPNTFKGIYANNVSLKDPFRDEKVENLSSVPNDPVDDGRSRTRRVREGSTSLATMGYVMASQEENQSAIRIAEESSEWRKLRGNALGMAMSKALEVESQNRVELMIKIEESQTVANYTLSQYVNKKAISEEGLEKQDLASMKRKEELEKKLAETSSLQMENLKEKSKNQQTIDWSVSSDGVELLENLEVGIKVIRDERSLLEEEMFAKEEETKGNALNRASDKASQLVVIDGSKNLEKSYDIKALERDLVQEIRLAEQKLLEEESIKVQSMVSALNKAEWMKSNTESLATQDINIYAAASSLSRKADKEEILRETAISEEALADRSRGRKFRAEAEGDLVEEEIEIREEERKFSMDETYLYYEVRFGERLWDIAGLYPELTIREIMDLNHLQNPLEVHAGMVLKIRRYTPSSKR